MHLGHLKLVTWGDNQPVTILFSIEGCSVDISPPLDQPIVVARNVQNKQKVWYHNIVFHPSIFSLFSSNMGGVDQL